MDLIDFKKPLGILISCIFLLNSRSSLAHEGHHHGTHTQEAKKTDARADLKFAYSEIQADYAKSVQPIFESKCAACHSASSESPWYAALPGISWLIESDRREAKEHLEISKGFPFAGHGEPPENLKAIGDTVTKDLMPPTLYSLMHTSSRLNDSEKETVLAWVNKSQSTLSALSSMEKKR
jgi:hypothetical protein